MNKSQQTQPKAKTKPDCEDVTMSREGEIVIPFSGFYCSIHDSNIDDAVERMFTDNSGEPNTGLAGRLYQICDFRAVRREYAKRYAEAFAREFGLPSLTFKLVDSPREYNFTTDRIFCTISEDDIATMMSKTPREKLEARAREDFTSRSGFISFYSPEITDWPPLAYWDHNQLACLLEAYVDEQAGDSFDEAALMEDAQCNGVLDGWIADNTDGIGRLYTVASYLCARADR